MAERAPPHRAWQGLSAEEAEKAKKRAERFGIPDKATATAAAVDPELEEKKKKRAERFGNVGGGAAAAPVDPEEEERRKKRAARFGAA